MSRTLEKLNSCAEEIKSKNPGVETAVVQADFAGDSSLAFYERIHAQIAGKDVSILVNNAGYADTGRMVNLTAESQKTMIDTNATPVVMLTRMFLPQMLRRKKRSAVLNISSIMGNFTSPGLCVYSATKHFVNALSLGLAFETADKVDLLSLTPSFVTTKMTGMRQGRMCITPQQCVSGALDNLGQERITYGHFRHELHGAMLDTMQTFAQARYVKSFLRLTDRSYKKMQEKKN